MKRYLCEKNVFMREHRTPAFKAGKPYPMKEMPRWNEFTDEFGTVHIADDWLLNHFRHLPDVPLVDHPDFTISVTKPFGELVMEDERLNIKGFLICAAVGFMVAISLIALFW